VVRLCVWGSSIARGSGDTVKGGWVERLRMELINGPKDLSVYNLSISGATSASLLERFDVEYKARQPEIVIIAIGLNDSAFFTKKSKPWIDITTYEKNIASLYNNAKKKSKVVFVGITPVDESKVQPIPWRKEL
jgi:lysophospholipase L1-like esterase